MVTTSQRNEYNDRITCVHVRRQQLRVYQGSRAVKVSQVTVGGRPAGVGMLCPVLNTRV